MCLQQPFDDLLLDWKYYFLIAPYYARGSKCLTIINVLGDQLDLEQVVYTRVVNLAKFL